MSISNLSSVLRIVFISNVFFCSFWLQPTHAYAQTSDTWYMAGANPGRTSWTTPLSEPTGIDWYRPIEPYIDGETQLVVANKKLYISTSRGLIVLDAQSGELVWRFDTDLPLGHSPTVFNNVTYVGGMDHNLYALNADTGALLWTFAAAKSGYSSSPIATTLAIYATNRDGHLYAISLSGQQLWKYQAGGPITMSPALYNSVLYFASQDLYGYAVNTDGTLKWKSAKLPGPHYTSWWPVIFQDQVVFMADSGYKSSSAPGARSFNNKSSLIDIDKYSFYSDSNLGSLLSGNVITSDGSQGWPAGTSILDTQNNSTGPYSITSYQTAFPSRRTMTALSLATGQETLNVPFLYTGTDSGNVAPPIVNPIENALYFLNNYSSGGIPRIRLMAWTPSSSFLKLGSTITYAIDEPTILSGSGINIYSNLCCDREAGKIFPTPLRFYWSYGGGELDNVLPYLNTDPLEYDAMWNFYAPEDELDRLKGYYGGINKSRNGVYASHGQQNPLTPYVFTNDQGYSVQRLFTHRSNTIIALGTTAAKEFKPAITKPASSLPGSTLSTSELLTRLESEISKILAVYDGTPTGFLRPGYYNQGGTSPESFYFQTPGDTLYTLSLAYPLISSPLKSQLAPYLHAYFDHYFQSQRVVSIGWNSGQPREDILYPPEVAADMNTRADTTTGFHPQRIFYAASKYAQLFPDRSLAIYTAIRPSLIYPPALFPDLPTAHTRTPYLINDYIAGYTGFLALQSLAYPGSLPAAEQTTRTNVQTELTNLLNYRTSNFSIDHPWQGTDNPTGILANSYFRSQNFSRNFTWLVPELATHLRQNNFSQIQTAVSEYSYLGPNWFMSYNDNTFQEGVMHPLYDAPALLSAKAWILGESQTELSKYIDIPAFPRGDLFYIQNLVTVIEAPTDSTPLPTPSPTRCTPVGNTDCNTNVNMLDAVYVILKLGTTDFKADIDGSGSVDLQDLRLLITNYLL